MLQHKHYLILGIGTNIGKTFLVEQLCQKLKTESIIFAIKPVASGFLDDDLNSDSAKIIKALELDFDQEILESISPWRFTEALSPHLAAKHENKSIDFVKLVEFCQKKIKESEDSFLFIEAAGGVMTPINDEKTFLDLAKELQIPVLLVSANYLGAISHTLCAMQSLENHEIFVEKIIVNSDLYKESASDACELIKTIANFSKTSTISLTDFLTSI